MKKKESLIRFLKENNGKPEDLTWNDLANMYEIRNNKTGDIDGRKANDIWRNYNKKKTSTNYNNTSPEGLVMTKMWGKPGNYSYSFTNESSVDHDEIRKSLIKEIKKYSPKSSPLPVINNNESVAYEISLPDFHIGRVSVKEAVTEYKTAVSQLLKRASHYKIDRFILPIGNDFFNSDNLNYTTTKGTSQFDVDDWKTTFRAGWRLLSDVITHLSTIAEVYVINVPGNHDTQRAFYLGDVLYAWFHNNENVIVNNSTDIFKFHQYGNNLIMFDHGELKSQDYPLIMATEAPIMFSETKYREVHVGHLHKEMLNEYRGVKVRYLPSIAKESQWEKKSGYKHIKCAQGLIWSKSEGLIGINQVNK